MYKPRIIIADEDINYILPLQVKFAERFFEKAEIEIISEKGYFDELFSFPQRVDVLIVSESLYTQGLQRHNVGHVFVLSEQKIENDEDSNVDVVFKYASIKEIVNEIIYKSADVLGGDTTEVKDTQVILVSSACGGVGKTTLAIGIAGALAKNYKRVLYINADYLQTFQHMFADTSPITENMIYAKLATNTENIYGDIKHAIRKEVFQYLPAFKTALMSVGMSYSVFKNIIQGAKKSKDYDYIVVDASSAFDDEKAALMGIADKIIMVLKQNMASVFATNVLMSNVNGTSANKYIFVCNDFDKEVENALIFGNLSLKYTVNDYVEHFRHYDSINIDELTDEKSIQKIAFMMI